MATSDQLLTSLNDIKDEIENLKDAVIDSNTHLLNITKMLTLLNASSARNARANDIHWKLNANQAQLDKIAETSILTSTEGEAIQEL